jgi:hypothetical protein
MKNLLFVLTLFLFLKTNAQHIEAVKNAGGIVIKLTRNPYNSSHESEMALDEHVYPTHNFDLVIYNDTISIEQQNSVVLTFLKKKGVVS